MALQILDRPSWQALTGQALGQGVGTGVADLLKTLAQKPELERQRTSAAQLFQQLGMPLEAAQAAARQPESIQREALKQAQNQQRLMQQQQQAQSFAKALQLSQAGGQLKLPEDAQLSEKQTTQLAKIGMQERQLKSQEQDRIIKQNRPFIKTLTESLQVAEPLYETAKEMLDLLQSGKLNSGPLRGRLPGAISDADSRYDQLAKKLVLLRSDALKGRPTDYKTSLIEKEKVSRDQRSQAQEKNLKSMLKDAEKIITQERIRQSLIEENNGAEPAALENLVKRKYHEYKRKSEGEFTNELPDASLEKGAKYEDTNTGEIYQSDGIQWIPVRGAQNAI